METKISIRKVFLQLRNNIPHDEREKYSDIITHYVLGMEYINRATHVLCYAGYGSEVQTMSFIEELLSLGKKVYLPRVNGEVMEFYRIEKLLDLEEGYKGIPEPKEVCVEIYKGECKQGTVMIMPGVAFSKDGSRMGYGKGYYDRYLEKYDIMTRVALCFYEQIAERIPCDIHDKKATLIVTEKGIIDCGKV